MSEFKFNCPYCQQKFSAETKDIGKEAICPSCQKEITITPSLEDEKNKKSPITPTPQAESTAQTTPEEVKINTKSNVVVCLVVIVSFVGLFMWIYYLWTAPPKNVDMSVTTTPKKASETEAWHIAMRFVEKQLKAPSTAKFPDQWDDGVTIRRLDDTSFSISGFVDAENSFGARIRQHWRVTVRYNKSDERWYRDDIAFF